MIKKLQLACAFLFLISLNANAQSGSIKGKIFDKATKETLPFASVTAESGGSQKGGGQSDYDGEYNIKPLAAGVYTVRVSSIGYNDLVITGVIVTNDKITFQDLAMSKKVVETKEVEIIAYKIPLIDKGNPSVTTTANKEDVRNIASRDVRSVVSSSAGVFQRDDNDDVNVRGSRTDATDYYVDGVRIRGSRNLPKAGIEQISVIAGGVPAQYGDVTGGVINVTTRGPEKNFSVGLNYETSELFDKFGHNLVALNVSGPLYSKKMTDGSKKPILGFFVAGDYTAAKDPDPPATGTYELKSDLFSELSTSPTNVIAPSTPTGVFSSTRKAEYFRADDFNNITIKKNTASQIIALSGKIDFQPDNNNTITIGGSLNNWDRNTFNIDRSVYNYNENPQRIDLDYRVFARYTKKLGGTYNNEEKSASILRNTYFSVLASYLMSKVIIQDEAHKKNFWNYGYRGKIQNNNPFIISPVTKIPNGDSTQTVIGLDTFYTHYTSNWSNPNHYSYTPTGLNPYAEAYNINAINGIIGAGGENDLGFLSELTDAGGLLNGSNPTTVYAQWQSIGQQFNSYQTNENEAYRFTFTGNTDIKNHAISLGFEFEQRVDRSFTIAPNGLWSVGRQYATANYDNLDFNTIVNDTLYVTPAPTYLTQSVNTFYERIRAKLGVANNQSIDFDALSPEQLNSLSLDIFTADQLIIESQLVNYAGFDYTGKKLTNKPSFYDFWNKKDRNAYTREVDAFRPIYMAGYIQDNFSIDNLVFKVGLRIDRFDANQLQLKDKYSLYDIKDAGEVTEFGSHPGNIKSDYIVYVDDVKKPTKILGYRDGDVWYDADGRLVSDPDFLARENSGKLVPYLVYPEEGNATGGVKNKNGWDPGNSFEDYKPQYTIMPRIAFSFPITDVAMFFAHYDVLSSRPAERLRLDPVAYIQDFNTSSFINNPNLKPEKTTHYELGFKQALNKSSALTLSAFYEERQNLIQVTKIPFAYPVTYTTYDNIDFANVKGFTLGFDLRRTGNVRLTANYTLQFADGTGSGANSNLELTGTDQPNIRIILPLDFDQRHLITMNFDYRYSSGSNYNGPILSGKQVFSNSGFSMQFRAGSGTPYTRQSRATPEANAIGWQSNGQRAVEGAVNSGRLPWTFNIDFKIDKDFTVKVGDKKSLSFNVYFQMQNALDIRNVTRVYRATGNANDDGYIQSADGILATSSSTDPVSFVDQYNMRMRNPDNFTIPRRSRIGVSVNF